MKRILLSLFVLASLSCVSWGQATLTQTTVTGAVNGNGGYSGLSPTVDISITVASTTGFVATNNGAIASYAYIDKELMGVLTVNTTTKVITVVRGQMGTATAPHATSAMVLVGTPNQFFNYDPAGACLSTAILSTPWLNVITGAQWLCSSVTGKWVPGFNNAVNVAGVHQDPTTAVASAAGLITPSGPFFHITGALAITGFNIPVGFEGGVICVVPDGTFTTTTANNISLASTAVVNKVLCWNFDSNTGKFSPSY